MQPFSFQHSGVCEIQNTQYFPCICEIKVQLIDILQQLIEHQMDSLNLQFISSCMICDTNEGLKDVNLDDVLSNTAKLFKLCHSVQHQN
jgi:hypothetical protein